MSAMLHWFTSPEWAQVVKALLHSLWQGALIALVLAIVLRRLGNPVARYRSSLVAMTAIVFSTIVTWAVINASSHRAAPSAHNQPLIAQAPAPDSAVTPELDSSPDTVVLVTHKPSSIRWTAWLAFAWFAGAILMLTRAGFKVAAAEQLRRSCHPLNDSRIDTLLAETRHALGIANRIRVGVTDKLTSPAVVGVVVPMLILPLALLTTLTPEQIRFVLLHELAHVRRRDYLANLFQFFAESLLFFNPAVWWISHQIRREREACCDALATELSGAPADYAQTLVHVAEKILYPAPTAAPAFGGKREPSTLAERVQRLLVPGYRPSLRLTWRAMLAALIFGSILLFLSAIGTRITVAAILTPQQRIAEIEKKNVEYGQNPAAAEGMRTKESVSVTARVRTPDGSPLPKGIYVTLYSQGDAPESRSTIVSWARVENDGTISNTVPGNRIWVQAGAAGFAPTVVGPFDATGTNRLDAGELVLNRGFDVWLKITDATSGATIRAPAMHTQSWLRDAGVGMQGPLNIVSDSSGGFVMSRCVDEPLDITINAPGYQITEQHFEHLHSGETLNIALKHGAEIGGIVTDKTTGRPIAGATIQMIYQKGPTTGHYEWNDPLRFLATTGADGRFTANQLQPATVYWLGVSAPSHESVLLSNQPTGQRDLRVQLGPALIVRGEVIGDVKGLQRIENHYALDFVYSEAIDNNSRSRPEWVYLQEVNGAIRFEFTNRLAGPISLHTRDGRSFTRDINAPVDNWVIDLNESPKIEVATNVPKREIIFRFKDPSGVPPQGTVSISIALPDSPDPNHLTAKTEILQITNGEVHDQIAIGARTSIEPAAMIGYWFSHYGIYDNFSPIEVTNGAGPMIIEVPVIPAGAIYARARNADGSPAGGLFFGVQELKRAQGRPDNTPLNNGGDGISDNSPRKWVSPPLPLGGTYRITGWRGNSICVSKPITLTGENPTAEIELQFAPTQVLEGTVLDASGRPIANANLQPLFTLSKDNSFSLNALFTDADGHFRIENVTPNLGDYTIQADAPGVMAERVKLDFKTQPQTIHLKPGHRIAGSLVEAGTGNIIPSAEIRALNSTNPKLPTVTTHTDANGHFDFTELAAGGYRIFVEGGGQTSQQTYHGDIDTNITIAVKLYPWSKLKPRPLALSRTNTVDTHGKRSKLAEKLDKFVIEKISPSSLPLSELVGILTEQTRAQDPDHWGINFILQRASVLNGSPDVRLGEVNINLDPSLTNVQLTDLLPIIAKSADRPIQVLYYDYGIEFSFRDTNANGPPGFVIESVDTYLDGSPRDKIHKKFDELRFDMVAFPYIPLREVVSNLTEMVKRRDTDHRGVNFILDETPSTTASSLKLGDVTIGLDPGVRNVKLADLLDAITTTAEPPIEYAVRDDGVHFSFPALAPSELSARTFKIDLNQLLSQRDIPAKNFRAEDFMLQWLSQNHIYVCAPKSLSYDDRQGILTVHATPGDLDSIGRTLGNYNASSETTSSVNPHDDEQIQTAQLVQDGKLLFQLGKYDKAQAKFRQVLKSDPDNQSGRYYLSLIKQARIVNATDSGSTNLYTRTFKLDPNTIYMGLQNLGLITSPTLIATNHGQRYVSVDNSVDPTPAIQTAFSNLFAAIGVTLSPPKSVAYKNSQNTLSVHATAADMNMIEAALNTLNAAPPEVNLKVRFVESSQTDNKALGFQWYLNNFVMGGGMITNSGSTQPSFTNTPSAANSERTFPGISATAGTRIAPSSTATNNQSSLIGILTDPQFKVVLNALQQSGGAELLSEADVTTVSGKQVQFQVGNAQTNAGATRITLDVIPYVCSDGSTIQLTTIPAATGFLISDEQRNSIQTVTNTFGSVPIRGYLPLPHSRIRQITFTNRVQDGQTLVLAGLLAGNTLYMKDKVPFLGDLPFVGRLFTSDSNQTQQKNVIIFVTPTIVNPAGNRIHSEDYYDSPGFGGFGGGGGGGGFRGGPQ